MLATMVTSIMANFHEKIHPKVLLKAGFKANKGTAASKVPAGQMNLQKVGEPAP